MRVLLLLLLVCVAVHGAAPPIAGLLQVAAMPSRPSWSPGPSSAPSISPLDPTVVRARLERTQVAAQGDVPLRTLPSFLKSSCINSNTDQMDALVDLGANTVRIYCNWRYLESSLTSVPNVTVAELRANTSWLEPYSASLSWSLVDSMVQAATERGLVPFVEIGEGTDHCLPTVTWGDSGVADPGTLGPSLYLAMMYRYCRAVVHRYGNVVPVWQLENELNDAYLEAVGGLRSPHSPLHDRNPWGNFTFVTELLETLYLAVKDEDPSLVVTQNVLAGTPQNAYSLFGFDAFFVDAVAAWQPLMDFVSFDFYPNMFVAEPDYSAGIGQAARALQAVLTDSSKGVFLAETGLTVMNGSYIDSVPSPVCFSEQQQATIINSTFIELVDAGGIGYEVFKTTPTPGFAPPEGGYSSNDVAFLQAVTSAIISNDITKLLAWAAHPRNAAYLASGRAATVLAAPTTPTFGILRDDASPTPAFDILQALYRSM